MNGARGRGSSWLLIALLAAGVQPESVGEASSPSAQVVPPSSCGRVVAVYRTCDPDVELPKLVRSIKPQMTAVEIAFTMR